MIFRLINQERSNNFFMFGMVKHITIVICDNAALWMKYYQYDIKLQTINQSLNNMNALRFHSTSPPLCVSLVGGPIQGGLVGFSISILYYSFAWKKKCQKRSPWKVKKVWTPMFKFLESALSYQLFTTLRIFWCIQYMYKYEWSILLYSVIGLYK